MTKGCCPWTVSAPNHLVNCHYPFWGSAWGSLAPTRTRERAGEWPFVAAWPAPSPARHAVAASAVAAAASAAATIVTTAAGLDLKVHGELVFG